MRNADASRLFSVHVILSVCLEVCCSLPESFPCVQVSSHPPLTNLPHPPPDLLDPQLRSAGAAEMQKYSHPLSIVPLHNNYLMQYYGDVGVRLRRSEWGPCAKTRCTQVTAQE